MKRRNDSEKLITRLNNNISYSTSCWGKKYKTSSTSHTFYVLNHYLLPSLPHQLLQQGKAGENVCLTPRNPNLDNSQ